MNSKEWLSTGNRTLYPHLWSDRVPDPSGQTDTRLQYTEYVS